MLNLMTKDAPSRRLCMWNIVGTRGHQVRYWRHFHKLRGPYFRSSQIDTMPVCALHFLTINCTLYHRMLYRRIKQIDGYACEAKYFTFFQYGLNKAGTSFSATFSCYFCSVILTPNQLTPQVNCQLKIITLIFNYWLFLYFYRQLNWGYTEAYHRCGKMSILTIIIYWALLPKLTKSHLNLSNSSIAIFRSTECHLFNMDTKYLRWKLFVMWDSQCCVCEPVVGSCFLNQLKAQVGWS